MTHHATIPSTGEEDGVAACSTATTDEETTTTGTTTATSSATTTTIGALIWKETLHQVMLKYKHSSEKGVSLRVDCHPKEITEEICLQLQQQAAAANNDTTIPTTTIVTDPFEGPIPMTLSASKCTHRLTVIQQCRNGTARPPFVPTTGVSWIAPLLQRMTTDNDDAIIMDLKLNHQAHAEIVRVPADNFTAADVVLAQNRTTDPTAPLSRAYYKLHQVWQDGHLSKQRPQPSQPTKYKECGVTVLLRRQRQSRHDHLVARCGRTGFGRRARGLDAGPGAFAATQKRRGRGRGTPRATRHELAPGAARAVHHGKSGGG